MALRCGSALLSLLFVAATVPGAVACSKKAGNASDGAAGDGAAEASASNDDAAVGTGLSGSVAPASAAVPSAAAPDEPQLPRPTPFTGSYRCFKGLQLLQLGSVVTSTMHKDATTDTVIACSAIGDTCTGTTRDVQVVRGKPPKVLHVRPITLVRTHGGDILFKTNPAGTAGTTDKPEKPEKNGARRSATPGKAAAGEETFCPHR